MIAPGRRGFTLVELLVVVILGSLILMASYQVLATNTRIYALNGARVQGQGTLRGALEVLSGELREISTVGGDLIWMGADSLTIRAQRAFGLVCSVNYAVSPVKITALQVGPRFRVGDSVFVFHDNDPGRASDDRWFGGSVSAVDATATCGGQQAQTLSLPFLRVTATALPPDSVRTGAPVRGFDVFTYGIYHLEGGSYLGRRARGMSDPDLLAGPLPSAGGLTPFPNRKNKDPAAVVGFGVLFYLNAPGRTRTCDPRLRRPMLYPTELRALGTRKLIQGFSGGQCGIWVGFKGVIRVPVESGSLGGWHVSQPSMQTPRKPLTDFGPRISASPGPAPDLPLNPPPRPSEGCGGGVPRFVSSDPLHVLETAGK